MKHPNNRTVGEICDEVDGIIRTGPFGSQLHQSDYKEDGLPVIMPKDIINGKVETESIARIGEDDEFRLKEHKLKRGDIVFARRGDLGRCALIHERENGWLCGTGSLRVSLGDTVVDPTYLFYYFNHADIISWIKSRAIGATLPNLNTSIIRDIPISYPSLPKQRKIADVLSTYDDLIEVNTRRIRILEQMAQSVYREWFGKVDAQSLPEGWVKKALGEIVEFMNGKANKFQQEGNYLVYGSNGIIGRTNEARYENAIIIGRVGAYCGSISYCTDKFSASDNTIIAFPSKTGYLGENFVYRLLMNMNLRRYAGGAAQPLLTQTVLKKLDVLVPPPSLCAKFEETAGDLFGLQVVLEKQNANLRLTRDLLLPRLVSGEVELVHE